MTPWGVICDARNMLRRDGRWWSVAGGQHGRRPAAEDQPPHSSARAERQQRNIARLLDGRGQPPLVRGAHAAQAAGHDLAAFGHKLREQTIVLVINGINLLHAELAHLLAAEVFASAFTRAAGP